MSDNQKAAVIVLWLLFCALLAGWIWFEALQSANELGRMIGALIVESCP